jgi:hypothetical protein
LASPHAVDGARFGAPKSGVKAKKQGRPAQAARPFYPILQMLADKSDKSLANAPEGIAATA